MAGAAPMQKRGGRKSLDAALNLVPFIDLLSCCIAFLLITACWTQLARIPVARPNTGGVNEQPAAPPIGEARPTLTLSPDGYTFERGGATVEIPLARGDYDVARLAGELRAARGNLPQEAGVSVRARDGVPYRELVRAMDTILAARFADIDLDGA